MNTKEIAIKLIFGDTIMIKDDEQAKEIRIVLRQIKDNCTDIIKQLNENLKHTKTK